MTKAATLQNLIFQNEDKAREALEGVRWPEGPFCPHCGNSDPEKIAKVVREEAKAPPRPLLLQGM